MNKQINHWIFQASPKQFDINKYLIQVDDYIYWKGRQNLNKMEIGDTVFIWRGGSEAGIVAIGTIYEPPTNTSNTQYPERLRDDLWYRQIEKNELVVGIKINEIRLTVDEGMVTLDICKRDLTIKNHRILTAPRQTNYGLNANESAILMQLWSSHGSNNAIYWTNESNQLEDKYELAIKGRTDISETKKKQLMYARRGQGIFKKNVCLNEKKCRVTGVTNIDYLIASHIKPWRKSTDEEKLHGGNGLLLSPHIDRLFDKGMISFTDNGELLISSFLDEQILKAWAIDPKRNVGKFKHGQTEFLKFHRENVFKN